jgi:8-amino-7-oxononanoate synthase
VAIAAMALIESDASLVAGLRARIARFRALGARAGLALAASQTAIQPIVLGEASRALAASERLLERGFLVPAIRPPTVPEGTSRLRISLSAAHSEADVAALVETLASTLA